MDRKKLVLPSFCGRARPDRQVENACGAAHDICKGHDGATMEDAVAVAEFVPDGLPWAHIDIAGPSYHTGGPWGYTVKGGTGVPVRTLLATIETLVADS